LNLFPHYCNYGMNKRHDLNSKDRDRENLE
jgi:hypothetical protein